MAKRLKAEDVILSYSFPILQFYHRITLTGNSVAYMQRPGGGEFSAGRLEVPEPIDAMSPTGDQRDVAVTFFFENVAEFLFELDVGRRFKMQMKSVSK